jgi:hypothetical protein
VKREKEAAMKWSTPLALALVAAWLILPTAQSQQYTKIQVNIPFDFIAGDTALQPGLWTIQRDVGGKEGTKTAMTLRSGKQMVMVNTRNRVHPRENVLINKLVFHVYGERRFLSEVWINSRATEVVAYAQETQAQKELGEPKVLVLTIKE